MAAVIIEFKIIRMKLSRIITENSVSDVKQTINVFSEQPFLFKANAGNEG